MEQQMLFRVVPSMRAAGVLLEAPVARGPQKRKLAKGDRLELGAIKMPSIYN